MDTIEARDLIDSLTKWTANHEAVGWVDDLRHQLDGVQGPEAHKVREALKRIDGALSELLGDIDDAADAVRALADKADAGSGQPEALTWVSRLQCNETACGRYWVRRTSIGWEVRRGPVYLGACPDEAGARALAAADLRSR